MVKEGLDRGLQVLVMNARGCSKSPLTTPQMFSAAWTEDIRHIALLVQEVIGVGTPLYAAGFSLGAGILVSVRCCGLPGSHFPLSDGPSGVSPSICARKATKPLSMAQVGCLPSLPQQ